jgi:uncharacterized protein (TIGR02466 family)
MHQINPIFAVPFVFDQLPEPDRLNRDLRELFLIREKEGARYANPNPYTVRNRELFESHFDLFDWPEACVRELREFCLSTLVRVVGELNGYDVAMLKRLRVATDAWFHVTRRNGFFAVHNHPMASWSGVYCVNPGQSDADQPDSGMLSFINPYTSMYTDAGTARIKLPYHSANYAFRLVPGQMILFPSWVQHQVMPFFGDDERITVAFNCAFQLT